jgi:D-arabinose 5-phosphate isomerase GutQ
MFASIIESVKATLIKESEAIEEIKNNLDEQQVNHVVKLLTKCKGKIITTGCGTSAAAAKKIAHTLSCIECPALFLSPSDAVHGGLGVVQKEDVVIVIISFLALKLKVRRSLPLRNQTTLLSCAKPMHF